jgi:recombination protein RecR
MTPLNTIQKLEKLFKDFPGIGPRQAKRFVYFLLTRNEEFTSEFVRLISELKHEATVCSSCFRYFSKSNPLSNQTLCSTCSDTERDATLLMIVSRDVDYENIERTSAYKGKYFVLGGVALRARIIS